MIAVNDGTELEKRISYAELYEKMAAAGIGAYFGLVVPGGAGIVSGAVMGVALSPWVAKIRQEWSRDQQRNEKLLMESACEAANKTAEEVFTLAAESPKARMLFNKALSAASDTVWDYKVKTLGRAMAQGLLSSDDTIVGMAGMETAAIADMDEPHLCLLEFLVGYEPAWRPDQRDPSPIDDVPVYSHSIAYDRSWHYGRRMWSEESIYRHRPRLGSVLRSLFGTLERHGLIEWDSIMSETLHDFAQVIQEDADKRMTQMVRGQRMPESSAALRWEPDLPLCRPTELGEEVYLRFREAGTEVPDVWTMPNLIEE